MATISTSLTKLFGIKHPILLAGPSALVIPGSSEALTERLVVLVGDDYRDECRRWT